MGDLNVKAVKEAIIRGLAPIDQRVSDLNNEAVTKAWEGFLKEDTKQLLTGAITVDEWKGFLASFVGDVTGVQGLDSTALTTEANSASQAVEDAFNPPSSMRWIVIGGIAATALAYWWLKKEEAQKEKLAIATPQIIAGSPRKRRPAIEIEPENVIEAEEI